MSVEYFVCENCGITFSDHGVGWVRCESCYTDWCSEECATNDGYIREHCSKHKDLTNSVLMEDYREKHCNYDNCCKCDHYKPDSCKYCRKEDYDDSTLLIKALELLKMSREDLIEMINKRQV